VRWCRHAVRGCASRALEKRKKRGRKERKEEETRTREHDYGRRGRGTGALLTSRGIRPVIQYLVSSGLMQTSRRLLAADTLL